MFSHGKKIELNLNLDSFPTQSLFTNSQLNYTLSLVSATSEEYLDIIHIISNLSQVHDSAVLGNRIHMYCLIRNISFVQSMKLSYGDVNSIKVDVTNNEIY